MVDRGRVDCPVALRKLSKLHRVVTHRGQAVTAWLPRQQNLAGLNVFLRNHGTAGGLGTSWKDRYTDRGAHRHRQRDIERAVG